MPKLAGTLEFGDGKGLFKFLNLAPLRSIFAWQQPDYLRNVRRLTFLITLREISRQTGVQSSRPPAHLKRAVALQPAPLSIASTFS